MFKLESRSISTKARDYPSWWKLRAVPLLDAIHLVVRESTVDGVCDNLHRSIQLLGEVLMYGHWHFLTN